MEEEEDLFDLIAAPAPVSPEKKKQGDSSSQKPKAGDSSLSKPENKGSTSVDKGSSVVDTRTLLRKGGPLETSERQQLLSKVGNADGPRNVQKRVREKTMAAICVDGANPITVLPKT